MNSPSEAWRARRWYWSDMLPTVFRSMSTSGPNAPEGSWELRSGYARKWSPEGEYDGTFREDWQFVEGSGDLDQCNGRFGMTPEFPEGIYHYYLTDDYPYMPRCVWGTPDPSFRQRRAGGRPPGGPGVLRSPSLHIRGRAVVGAMTLCSPIGLIT